MGLFVFDFFALKAFGGYAQGTLRSSGMLGNIGHITCCNLLEEEDDDDDEADDEAAQACGSGYDGGNKPLVKWNPEDGTARIALGPFKFVTLKVDFKANH